MLRISVAKAFLCKAVELCHAHAVLPTSLLYGGFGKPDQLHNERLDLFHTISLLWIHPL